jgi:hypothetical protein
MPDLLADANDETVCRNANANDDEQATRDPGGADGTNA